MNIRLANDARLGDDRERARERGRERGYERGELEEKGVGRETREKADERERCNGLEAHVLKILK